MIFIQTKALVYDAYRELNAKKLFWLALGLNLFAVFLFAALGINAEGVTFLVWTFENQMMNTQFISKELFYKLQFTTWGVPFWLSWVTAILALISTAGIIPDMVSGGAIEPMLSKPIGRTRLFLTKYFTGLLFVGLQILVFSVGCLLVLGIRAGVWEFGLLLAIPIVVVFFSYLFSFCVFVGLITRSTIAALLLTILFWVAIFIANSADGMLISQREGSILRVEDRIADVEAQERFATKRIDQLRQQGKPIPGENGEPLPNGAEDPLTAANPTLISARERLAKAEKSVPTWETWASRVFMLKTLLPKTQETIALLSRHLISDEELSDLMGGRNQSENQNEPAFADPRVTERVEFALRKRTIGWVLGTSLLFETILLGFCVLIFRRRDF